MERGLAGMAAPDVDAPSASGTWASLPCRSLGPVADPVLDRLLAGDPFTCRRPADPADYSRLIYRRMRALAGYLGSEPLGDQARLQRVMERAAVLDPVLFHGLLVHYYLAMGTLVRLGGNRSDLADHVTSLATMSSTGSFMITEIGAGNSHAAPGTIATFDAGLGSFVLHTPHAGAQKFPPNVALAGIPRLAVVFAELRAGGQGHGLFPFLVPVADGTGPLPGVRITALPPTTLMPFDYAVVSFDRVQVPPSGWLRDSASLAPDGSFHDPLTRPQRLARSLCAASSVWAVIVAACAAVSRASVTLAVRHAYRRTAIGRLPADEPVIGYRHQQRELFGALADAYAITCLADHTGPSSLPATGSSGRGPDEGASPWVAIDRGTALAKAAAAHAAEQVTAACRRASGALGFFSANRFLDYQGLAHAYRTAGGDSQLILLDTARSMVEGAGYDPPAAVPPPGPGLEDLADRRLWVQLAASRERLLHERLAAALHQAANRDRDPFGAWNDHIPQALELAEAHAARLTLEAVLAATRPERTGQQHKGLDTLCEYYALTQIARHAAWYQCEGLLSPQQRHGLSDVLNALSDRLLRFAPAIVEAMGMPPGLSGAPLAAEDYRTGFAGFPGADDA
jgi:acyl-CoA oxidase